MCQVIECVGYLALSYLAIKLGSWAYRRFLAVSLDVTKCGGNWALVTGSTDGIGKAYAQELARKGMNLILVSRSTVKLEEVAAELSELNPAIDIKILELDFAKEDPTTYIPKVEDFVKNVEIGLLVNNVGMSYEHPMEFLELTLSEDLINVNITSLNTMTRIVLPQMVARKAGAIINISSLSANFPTPLLSVYAASKSYVDLFSQSLAKEYESCGITVQVVLPGYVVTKMSNLKGPNLFAPTPDAFVKSAISRLGIDQRTTGYWAHDLMATFTTCLPRSIVTNLVYKEIKNIRAKALLKKSN